MKILIPLFILILSIHFCAFGQLSDITQGCVPLKIKFNSAPAGQYFWNFKDGTFATTQNPEHTYTKPGVYEVTLQDGQNGNVIGQTTISVFDKPTLNITGTPSDGCVPLSVQFDASVIADPAIMTSEYKWTFGDGASAQGKNPKKVYSEIGNFDVGLEIKSDLAGCDNIKIFPNYIKVHGLKALMDIEPISECEPPFTYLVKNKSISSPGNKYFWDFGNGQTSENYDGGQIVYPTAGVYRVTLKITDNNGCTDSIHQELIVGKPSLKISLKRDSICINERVVVTNSSPGNKINWFFDATASIPNSILRTPQWHYTTPGTKLVKYSVGNENTCIVDTVFTIYVEPLPDASFSFTPAIGCKNPLEINLQANNQSYRDYIWYPTSLSNSPVEKILITDPQRDSLYMHYKDTIILKLDVKTHLGCIASHIDTAFHQIPDAYFITNQPKGCVPLPVTFKDKSYSHLPIKSIQWIFGDGQSIISNGTDDVTHIYTKAGQYYARSIIENMDGCIDTSASLLIKVGENIKPSLKFDQTTICLGESIHISLENNDPRIGAFHIYTDDGRFSHCWTGSTAEHKFLASPGIFPVISTIDYNGCITNDTLSQEITVKGAKANIGYMIDCADPLHVMLESKSLGSTNVVWQLQDTLISINTFNHRFDHKGDYEIKLIAQNTIDGCPADTVSQIIKLRQVQAIFTMPEIVCDKDSILLNPLASIDVDNDCSKGYLWKFTHKRPHESDFGTYGAVFPAGKHTVSLIVEDLNGCRDTLTKNIESFGIYPNIEVNKTEFCFPFTLTAKDLSTSDAPIVNWNWNTGHTSPSFSTLLSEYFVQKPLVLELEDIHGCKDMITLNLSGYKPTSSLLISPQNTVCVGNPVQIFATDYTLKGSKLKFLYEFENNETATTQFITRTYQNPGTYLINLKYEEESSGCKDSVTTKIHVVGRPQAKFVSSEDGNEVICHPKIIDFTNQTTADSTVFYLWQLGKNNSTLTHPSEAFAKGQHQVVLYAISPFGCQDTTSKIFTLVGPEGQISKDKTILCNNEKVSLAVINQVDIGHWTWQFGDGTIIENESPITKSFDPEISTSAIPIELIIKSSDNGCTSIIRDSIAFETIKADFNFHDTSICQGLVYFENLSIGAKRYEWSFGSNNNSQALNPNHLYNEAGEKSITLIAISDKRECRDTLVKQLLIDKFDDIIFYPNVFTPNDDGENDVFSVIVPQAYEGRVSVNTLKIYNRWGHLISENKTWDGKYNGVEAPAEVYAYYMEVTIDGCRSYSKKGNVTLMR